MNRSRSPPVHLHFAQRDNRATSPPVHLHVGKKTPVHLHIKPGKKRLSRLEQQQLSCSEMAAGRPSIRASGSISASHSRSNNWLSPPSTKTPWVPPPGKSSKSQMAWEGQTHRLEIHPNPSGTVLHVDDLSGGEGSSELLLNNGSGDYQKKVDCLKAQMDHLKAEVDLQKSLRELEEKEMALKDSMSSLKLKEAELSHCQEELLQSELDRTKRSSRSPSPRRSTSPKRPRSALEAEENRKRERLMAQLAAVQGDGLSVMRNANRLKASIKKLQKDRRFASVQAAQVSENKEMFLASLAQFEKSHKLLSKMVQAHHAHHTGVGQLVQQRDLLEQRLNISESSNQLLRERLEEQQRMTSHTQELHDQIGQRDGEIQALEIRIQSLEEQLRNRDLECSELQHELSEAKKLFQRDKEALKKATKQHKDRAVQNGRTLETVGTQLEEANTEFVKLKAKLAKSNQEIVSYVSEITALKTKIHELEACLSQTRITSKVSLDAVSAQLSEKAHEVQSLHIEMDRLKAHIATMEAQQRNTESGHHVKISSLESELTQLNSSMTHNQEIVMEYKAQLERSRSHVEQLDMELRAKEQEIDQLKRESMLESEKYRLKYQQQLSELEPMPEMLKHSERRLTETQERLLSHEQRCGEQTRLIAELSLKAEQNAALIESLRGKLQEALADKRAAENQLTTAEQKRQEAEQQNRELMGISGRKEEMVERLQARVEEVVQEMATLSAQLEASKAEARRHAEQIKERAGSKERANLARISDLETQLTRANTLATQFRKSKDDLERRYHSRVQELQERLEQANSTKRSLENYITFLKSSYASVFTDSHSLHMPGSPVSPLTH